MATPKKNKKATKITIGGELHWTHSAPRINRLGGWIEFDGKRYQ